MEPNRPDVEVDVLVATVKCDVRDWEAGRISQHHISEKRNHPHLHRNPCTDFYLPVLFDVHQFEKGTHSD